MALLKAWIVFFSIAFVLFLVITALRCSGGPSATYNQVPLHDGQSQTDGEMQDTCETVSLSESQIDSETQHNPIEAMYRRLVVLTAFSSNHFREALDMIGSVQRYLPCAKIIVYDIGLKREERGKVSVFCNVELRSFKFNKYPPYVKRNINNYAWKPLILHEVVDEGYDVILFGDTSLRLIAHNISTALQCLLDFPFLDIKFAYLSIISTTHDKMIKYFQFPPSRQYMAHWGSIQSGGWFILVNDLTREMLIAPWVDCALHKECIAPEGATKGHCKHSLNTRNDGTYIGCHRYDQSALNIILAKNFGFEIWDKVVRNELTSRLATVVRHPEGIYPVKQYPHCNNS